MRRRHDNATTLATMEISCVAKKLVRLLAFILSQNGYGVGWGVWEAQPKSSGSSSNPKVPISNHAGSQLRSSETKNKNNSQLSS